MVKDTLGWDGQEMNWRSCKPCPIGKKGEGVVSGSRIPNLGFADVPHYINSGAA